ARMAYDDARAGYGDARAAYGDARTGYGDARTARRRGSTSDQATTETVITQPIAAQPPAPEPTTAERSTRVPTAEQATNEPATSKPVADQPATGEPAPDEVPPTGPRRRRRIGVPAHRRGPGLWFPVTVFLVLLIAAAAVGRFVVPRPGPNPGAAPSGGPPPAPTEAAASPTLPPLPTPPVRPADALADWAGRVGAAIGVPPVAIQAYGYAQLLMQDSDPSCKLSWTTLAGVGEVESFHGQADGAVLGANGRSDPVIIGPPLDGQDGRARVADTDAGAYDGDTSFDRAMGPLRLTPSMWRTYAADA